MLLFFFNYKFCYYELIFTLLILHASFKSTIHPDSKGVLINFVLVFFINALIICPYSCVCGTQCVPHQVLKSLRSINPERSVEVKYLTVFSKSVMERGEDVSGKSSKYTFQDSQPFKIWCLESWKLNLSCRALETSPALCLRILETVFQVSWKF